MLFQCFIRLIIYPYETVTKCATHLASMRCARYHLACLFGKYARHLACLFGKYARHLACLFGKCARHLACLYEKCAVFAFGLCNRFLMVLLLISGIVIYNIKSIDLRIDFWVLICRQVSKTC